MKLVSVVMPCYNDGKYLFESINSVKTQTYKAVELIIVDDGSDDPQTLRIQESINDNNSKFIRTAHAGPARARNVGIQAARGEYILPLDADDRIDHTYIEKAVRVLESSPNVDVVYCLANLFGNATGPWKLPTFSLGQMLVDNVVFISSMFRKSDWELVGGFSSEFPFGLEDYDFWLSFLEAGKNFYQIPEALFEYRIKDSSRNMLLAREKTEHMQATYELLYKRHINLYQEHMEQYAIALRSSWIERTIRMWTLEDKLYHKTKKTLKYKIVNKLPKLSVFTKKMLHR